MASLPPLTHHEIVERIEPFVRAGRQVDLGATDRDARRIAFKPVARDGGLMETLTLDLRLAQRAVLERRLAHPGGAVATARIAGPEPAELLRRIDALAPAEHFREGPGFVIARCWELGPDGRFLHDAELRLDGLRVMLALRLPALRGVAGDLVVEPLPGHRIQLPEDAFAVLGWDWARLEKKRDGWISKLRLRGRGLARSRAAEMRLEQLAPHLVRLLAEPPAQFHRRHLAARWGVVLRRSIPTATALALIGTALLLPQFVDEPRAAGYWMALHYVPIALLALSFRLQEMSRFELPRWPRRPREASWRQ